MFWRKQRAAIDTFHPLHQELIWNRRLSASLYPGDWAQLIGSLAGHSASVRRRKWALPERTGTVLVPLIRVLAEDMKPGGVLSVVADLRGAKAQGKLGPEQRIPTQRRGVRKLFETHAYDPWLRVRAELRDGSVLEMSAADRVRYRRVHKVNPRGKHKVKRKTKITHVLSVSRRLPPGAPLTRPGTPPPPWMRVKMREGRRTLIKTSAKLQAMRDDTVFERVLQLSAEPFRWTPPGGPARPSTKTG